MWRVAVGVHTCVSRSTFPRLVHSLPVARLFLFFKIKLTHVTERDTKLLFVWLEGTGKREVGGPQLRTLTVNSVACAQLS